jgi:3-dehydroshikimate dehydratase
VSGRLQEDAPRRFVVELFGNVQARGSEGETFLGRVVVQTGADGAATFSLPIDRARNAPALATLTATVTSADGATSEFSTPLNTR